MNYHSNSRSSGGACMVTSRGCDDYEIALSVSGTLVLPDFVRTGSRVVPLPFACPNRVSVSIESRKFVLLLMLRITGFSDFILRAVF
jgi:hypothetical protein